MIQNKDSMAVEAIKKQIRAQKYASLMLDWTFKRVFGQEKNKKLLISLLNSILPELEIRDVEYRTTELASRVAANKNFILDLRCTTKEDKEIIIELQNYPQQAFFERCVSYGAYAYSNELEEGEYYDELTPVYVVAIVSDQASEKMNLHEAEYDDKVVYNYIFMEKDSGEVANQTIMVTFVELNKFTKAESECVDELERWFYVLKNAERITRLHPSFQTEVFKQVFKEIDVATFTRDEKMRHFREMLAKYDERKQREFCIKEGIQEGFLKGLKEGHAEGKKIGVQEGLKEGRKEGRIEGVQEGIAQGRKETMLEIARQLKNEGLANEVISRTTGLSIEQVENI